MNKYLDSLAQTIYENEYRQREITLSLEVDVLDNLKQELSADPNNNDLQLKIVMQTDRIEVMNLNFSRQLMEISASAKKEVYGA